MPFLTEKSLIFVFRIYCSSLRTGQFPESIDMSNYFPARIRKVPLHAAGSMRLNLHGHRDRRHDTLVRSASCAMRLGDGLHFEGVANSIPNVR